MIEASENGSVCMFECLSVSIVLRMCSCAQCIVSISSIQWIFRETSTNIVMGWLSLLSMRWLHHAFNTLYTSLCTETSICFWCKFLVWALLFFAIKIIYIFCSSYIVMVCFCCNPRAVIALWISFNVHIHCIWCTFSTCLNVSPFVHKTAHFANVKICLATFDIYVRYLLFYV